MLNKYFNGHYYHHIVIMLMSSAYLLASTSSPSAATADQIASRKAQPKTSLGYKCVRRNHQLFCPKPPTHIHGKEVGRSSALDERQRLATTINQPVENKSVNYSYSTTKINENQLSTTDSEQNEKHGKLPCLKCDRSSSTATSENQGNKFSSSETTSTTTNQQKHSPSFYAYLPHDDLSAKHPTDPHEHLIVDVAHDKLHHEHEKLHEATIVHRVKRNDIHEFIEENRALMKRMFGTEPPPPPIEEDELVSNRNTLYPMSNYAYASDPLDEESVDADFAIASDYHDASAQHDHYTNNRHHYRDNYSGQHHNNDEHNINSTATATITATIRTTTTESPVGGAKTGSLLLSTGNKRHQQRQPARSFPRAQSPSLSAHSQAAMSSGGGGGHFDARRHDNVYQQTVYKQATTGELSTKVRNVSRESETILDHDVATRGDARHVARSKRSSASSPASSSSSSSSSRTNNNNNNKQDLFAQRVDSCESHLEVVTPYWATNSHGHVRAIVNSQHMQQAIQQEICKTTTTARCSSECSCEQKYKWHRMLAYDPEENCKGIFMDWFLFPSNCVCRCLVKSASHFVSQQHSLAASSASSASSLASSASSLASSASSLASSGAAAAATTSAVEDDR